MLKRPRKMRGEWFAERMSAGLLKSLTLSEAVRGGLVLMLCISWRVSHRSAILPVFAGVKSSYSVAGQSFNKAGRPSYFAREAFAWHTQLAHLEENVGPICLRALRRSSCAGYHNVGLCPSAARSLHAAAFAMSAERPKSQPVWKKALEITPN